MEIHPENEPLLNKEDKDLYVNIQDIENIKNSKEQIINCQDCLELICFCCYNYDVTQKEYDVLFHMIMKILFMKNYF